MEIYNSIHLTAEGRRRSISGLGPSYWPTAPTPPVGEPSLESVLLSEEFMLVSFTLEKRSFTVSSYRNRTYQYYVYLPVNHWN